MAKSRGGTPATVALTRAGVAFTLHEYAHDPRATSYGLEAAEALGLDPDRSSRRCWPRSTASSSSRSSRSPAGSTSRRWPVRSAASKAAMAEPKDAERVDRLRHRRHLARRPEAPRCRTVVDESATAYDVVYVSAGRRGLDLGIAPADLVAATGAITADVSRS